MIVVTLNYNNIDIKFKNLKLINNKCNLIFNKKEFYILVSCTIWTRRDIKKAELSVLDISSAIIARVESMPESMNYFYGGLMLSVVLSLIPSIKRLSDHVGMDNSSNVTNSLIPNDLTYVNLETYSDILSKVIDLAFGTTLW